MVDPEVAPQPADEEDVPTHPFWKDEKVLGSSTLRAKHAARAMIVAVVLAFITMGIVLWLAINGISKMNDEFSTNHHDRIVQEAKFRQELQQLQNENKDLACSTRAFFLAHTPKGRPESPFLVFLNRRYHCGDFKLTP